jgi:uncharacterized membrane protein
MIEPITLEKMVATRNHIETLYAHHFISSEARAAALEILYPHKNWGLWASRLLLIFGVSLILSGIVYFFAFNWYKLTPLIKFIAVESGIIACLVACYFYGLQTLGGKFFLLSASVLIGVFLAVFGQIYQTGADSYELFRAWALLIAIWVIISQHLALWALWVVIINTFTILYWLQVFSPTEETTYLIFSYLMILNGCFLIGKEYFSKQGILWLKPRWARFLLVIALLACATPPIILWIFHSHQENSILVLSAFLGSVIHLSFLIVYRYKLPDIGILTLTILSVALIAEVISFRILEPTLEHSYTLIEVFLLMMTLVTIGIFATATMILRYLAKELENQHG